MTGGRRPNPLLRRSGRPRSPLNRPAQSFDVFDTCVVRTYLDPADLVYDLAERVLAARDGRPAASEEVAELAFHRLSTHRRLLGDVDRDEVGLAEVYEAMGSLERWGVDASRMHDQELALERASCRPVAAVVAAVAQARAAGQRVLFLSDMWLPQPFVRSARPPRARPSVVAPRRGSTVPPLRADVVNGVPRWTWRAIDRGRAPPVILQRRRRHATRKPHRGGQPGPRHQ